MLDIAGGGAARIIRAAYGRVSPPRTRSAEARSASWNGQDRVPDAPAGAVHGVLVDPGCGRKRAW